MNLDGLLATTLFRNATSSIAAIVKGQEESRSSLLRNNAVLSLVFRIISVVIGLVIVSMTLNCLGAEEYGIWLTLTSIVAWFSMFDLGLGYGFRNKLAEALARNDTHLAKVYVATAYAIISVIAGVLASCIVVFVPRINWPQVLNASPHLAGELTLLAVFVFLAFAIRFVTSLINVVLNADQKAWIVQAIDTFSSLVTLLGVFLISRSRSPTLLVFGGTLSLVSFLTPLAASIIFFRHRYRWLRPQIAFVRLEYFKDLSSLGAKFFLLQLTGIAQFSIQSILINQLVGTAEVASYNIAFKYFSLAIVFYGAITIPLWSAFTAAYANKDIQWIRLTVRRVTKLWLIVAFGVLAMLAISPYFYRLWLGTALSIEFWLSGSVVLFVLLSTWNTVFTLFVNGVGKIWLQLSLASIAALMNIPLAFFLVRSVGLGAIGVVLSTVICMLPNAIVTPLQYARIVHGKARGIWDA